MVIYEDHYDLQYEFHCDKGYEDDVECNVRKDNKTPCKDDDTSYKDVGSCKDDSTSYKDDGSCKNDSTSCKDDKMKIPKQKRTENDENDGGRNMIGNNDDIVEIIDLCSSDDKIINLCSSDDSNDDNGKQYDKQYDWIN